MPGEWTLKSEQFVTFAEEGQVLEGELTDKTYVDLPGGTVMRCVLQNEEGRWSFLCTQQLERDLGSVAVGTIIHIVYRGESKTPQGRRFKAFEVWVQE